MQEWEQLLTFISGGRNASGIKMTYKDFINCESRWALIYQIPLGLFLLFAFFVDMTYGFIIDCWNDKNMA